MRKIIYPLFVFVFLFGLVSCEENIESKANVEKENQENIKTITWEEAKEYRKLSEKDFLKHELFNKPDKQEVDSISRYRIIHRYYYKNKLAINGEKRHWVFSFENGHCFGHGWAKKAFD